MIISQTRFSATTRLRRLSRAARAPRRHAVEQASRNLYTGADRSGAPTVPSLTNGIDAPGLDVSFVFLLCGVCSAATGAYALARIGGQYAGV